MLVLNNKNVCLSCETEDKRMSHGSGRVVSESDSETSVLGSTPASAIIYDAYTSNTKKERFLQTFLSVTKVYLQRRKRNSRIYSSLFSFLSLLFYITTFVVFQLSRSFKQHISFGSYMLSRRVPH